VLLRDLSEVRVTVRKTDAQVFAESVRRVVPAVERDRFDRQLIPLRELHVDEAPYNSR
jgi:hypothetical protein